jgi:hypothetical protein
MTSTVGSASSPKTGEWRRASVGYLRPHSLRCALCGQLLPGRYWSDSVGKTFCGLDHECLYRSYWIPRYGASAQGRGVSDQHETTSRDSFAAGEEQR